MGTTHIPEWANVQAGTAKCRPASERWSPRCEVTARTTIGFRYKPTMFAQHVSQYDAKGKGYGSQSIRLNFVCRLPKAVAASCWNKSTALCCQNRKINHCSKVAIQPMTACACFASLH